LGSPRIRPAGGNSARWLNHACAPNCETIEAEGRIFIHTVRAIGKRHFSKK
jgi:SET domain-containing protein